LIVDGGRLFTTADERKKWSKIVVSFRGFERTSDRDKSLKSRVGAGREFGVSDKVANSEELWGRDPVLLRLSLGFVYFHFGLLKFFPDLSPAEWMAEQTLMKLSWYWLAPDRALWLLAVFECLIGLGLLFKVAPKTTLVMFFVHMAGTYLPAVFIPEFIFKVTPLAPSLEGQYIIKNLVFLAAGWTVLVPHAFPRRERKESRPKTAQAP
jgi:uncharacterized membrane protein YkgB